ncbi:acyl-coenzyme A thioesterase 13-like [Panonychus citri]|uniref:acyl-coenzyme A thioesterase 13-like n=1 Tax=Panonychus citri TaxID=50023 RepID=UPI0023082094|nr:acyl-coenzyme A thioesterase 13-like [Panonychus citri]
MSSTVLPVVRNLLKRRVENGNFDKILEKVTIVKAGGGNLTAEVVIDKEHSNRSGGLHGAFIATLVDVMSTLALASSEVELISGDVADFSESASASVALNVTYIRPMTIGQTLLIECSTLNRGRTMAYLNVDLLNKDEGKLIARGTHSKMLFNKSK